MLPRILLTVLFSVAAAAPNNKPPGVCKRGIYGNLAPLAHYKPAQEFCITEFGYQTVTATVDSRRIVARGTTAMSTTPAAPSTTPVQTTTTSSSTTSSSSSTSSSTTSSSTTPSSTTSSSTTSSSTTSSPTTASSSTTSSTTTSSTTARATTTSSCTTKVKISTTKCATTSSAAVNCHGKCYGKLYECMLSSAKCQKKEVAKTLCSCILPPKTVTVRCKTTTAKKTGTTKCTTKSTSKSTIPSTTPSTTPRTPPSKTPSTTPATTTSSSTTTTSSSPTPAPRCIDGQNCISGFSYSLSCGYKITTATLVNTPPTTVPSFNDCAELCGNSSLCGIFSYSYSTQICTQYAGGSFSQQPDADFDTGFATEPGSC